MEIVESAVRMLGLGLCARAWWQGVAGVTSLGGVRSLPSQQSSVWALLSTLCSSGSVSPVRVVSCSWRVLCCWECCWGQAGPELENLQFVQRSIWKHVCSLYSEKVKEQICSALTLMGSGAQTEAACQDLFEPQQVLFQLVHLHWSNHCHKKTDALLWMEELNNLRWCFLNFLDWETAVSCCNPRGSDGREQCSLLFKMLHMLLAVASWIRSGLWKTAGKADFWDLSARQKWNPV